MQGWVPATNAAGRIVVSTKGNPSQGLAANITVANGPVRIYAPPHVRGNFTNGVVTWDEFVPDYGTNSWYRVALIIMSPHGEYRFEIPYRHAPDSVWYGWQRLPTNDAWNQRSAFFDSFRGPSRLVGDPELIFANVQAVALEFIPTNSTDFPILVDNIVIRNQPPLLSARTAAVQICWEAVVPDLIGIGYAVLYRSELTSNDWVLLSVEWPERSGRYCMTDFAPLDEPKRFYKIEEWIYQGLPP
jgi:hypothetical protein